MLMPTSQIKAAANARSLPQAASDLPDDLALPSVNGSDLQSYLKLSETDSMMILHDGKKVWDWCAPHSDTQQPHIVFSVSKSITAMAAGILLDQKVIDVDKAVSHYLPGARGSAYENCSVQQLLDMSVALAFEEDYLNPSGDFFDYRNATCWNPVDQTGGGPTLEPFLYSLKKADYEHGEIFNYKSPNSDLLGLVLERSTGVPYSELLSELLWQPMGASTNGNVTVDRGMVARAAGGISVTLSDLALFGQLVLDKGAVGGRTIIPEHWIHDTSTAGSREAWIKGSFATLMPEGCYRNKWYQIRNQDGCIAAMGIHGQWLYINPTTRVVIAKLSSQSLPLNEKQDISLLGVFEQISKAFSTD